MRLFLAQLVVIAGGAWWLLSPATPLPLVVAAVVAGLVAVVTLGRSPAPAVAPAYAPESEPARAHMSWRARGWVLVGVCLAAGVSVGAGAGVRPSAPPAWVLVAVGAGVLATLVMIFRSGEHGPDQSLRHLSSGGGAAGLQRWQAEVLDSWYEGIRGVPRLALRDPADPSVLVGVAVPVEPVQPVAGGGVAFGVDCRGAWAVAEDVAESGEQLRRMLGAAVLLVEPVPTIATVALVTAYRGQPFTGRPGERLVSWRNLRPIPGDPDAVPVGETAYADLLGDGAGTSTGTGAGRGAGTIRESVRAVIRDRSLRSGRAVPALSGRPAVLSKRGSILFDGAADSGKSGGIRAVLRGLLVQQTPIRPYVWDNKGEFLALKAAIEALGGVYVGKGAPEADGLAMLRTVEQLGDSRYATQGEAYEHHDTLTDPRAVVIVGEWLTAGETLTPAEYKDVQRIGVKIVTNLRGAGIILLTCAQLAEKTAGLHALREGFPQVVTTRTTSANQSKMALDPDDLRRGASPHTIPRMARGVFWTRDGYSAWPYLGRFAWISKDDQYEALVRPMLALAARMPGRRVIDAEEVAWT